MEHLVDGFVNQVVPTLNAGFYLFSGAWIYRWATRKEGK